MQKLFGRGNYDPYRLTYVVLYVWVIRRSLFWKEIFMKQYPDLIVGNFKKEDNWLIALNKRMATANRIIKRQKQIDRDK
jgi:hypothetical protein